MPCSLLDMAVLNISMSSTSSSHDMIAVMIVHHLPPTTISEQSRTSPPCRSQPSVLVMRAIVARSVAIVANHVGIVVKPDCHVPTMLSLKRKAPRAAEPKSSPSSERRKSTQTLLLGCYTMVVQTMRALHIHLRSTPELPASYLTSSSKAAPTSFSPKCILPCLSCIRIKYEMLSARWATPSNHIASSHHSWALCSSSLVSY